MQQAIIVLTVIGFLMIAAEVFVPGYVLGSLGFLCLAGVVVLCYMAFGPLIGTLAFAGILVLTTCAFLLWLRYFPLTPIGKRFILRQPDTSGNPAPESLVGQDGIAITPLRPAGTARIGDRRLDVVADAAFVDAGTPVTVVLHEGLRIVVRPQPTADTPEKQD